MISRRTFLSRVAGGVVASAVVAHIPIQLIPESVRKLGAQDYLFKEYHKAYRGIPSGRIPRHIDCGRELFEAYEDTLTYYTRWSDTETTRAGLPNLMFKNTTLRPTLDGWCVNFTTLPEKIA